MKGLADDSVTRLNKNEVLTLDIPKGSELHCAENFMRLNGDARLGQY